MAKEVEFKICEVCESQFKLVYDPNKTSGLAKFCPFCQSDLHDDDEDKPQEPSEEE